MFPSLFEHNENEEVIGSKPSFENGDFYPPQGRDKKKKKWGNGENHLDPSIMNAPDLTKLRGGFFRSSSTGVERAEGNQG